MTSFLATGTASACTASGPPPTAIALVDTDAGPTGARVADSLRRDDGGYEWRFVTTEEASAGTYAAVITLPADLTAAMDSPTGPDPRRATVTVVEAEGVDRELVDGATTLLTRRIGATGAEQVRTLVTSLATQPGRASLATQPGEAPTLPTRDGDQRAALARASTDPVEIVRK